MKPETVFDLIDLIAANPGMYLSRRSAFQLGDVLTGFCWGRDSSGGHEELLRLGTLQQWFERRYAGDESGNFGGGESFARILVNEADGDEEKALNRFFELWRIFVQENTTGRRGKGPGS